MIETINAIETKYKGYRFRSRLEARWAVFFDSLNAKWLYEYQGYKLESGWYLPDFFLPEPAIWVEIKPEGGTCKHACNLFYETGHPVVVASGMPPGDLIACVQDEGDSSMGYTELYDCEWCEHANKRHIAVCANTYRTLMTPDWEIQHGVVNSEDGDALQFGVLLDIAVEAAKSARFEHGERG